MYTHFQRTLVHLILTISIILPGIPIPATVNPAVQAVPPAPGISAISDTASPEILDATPVTDLPAFLPYSLGAAVEIPPSALTSDETMVQIELVGGVMPDGNASQHLVHIFYFDSASRSWQKLPTQRESSGDTWTLSAPANAPGVYAGALATTPDSGGDPNPNLSVVEEMFCPNNSI